MAQTEVALAASKQAKAAPSGAKKSKKKKNQPGTYSQLVLDTIRKLGKRNGSSLAKIYNEAKKVSWFDQQNGCTYLKYSVKALVQNNTLLQVKGVRANGSFQISKKKLEGQAVSPQKSSKPAAAKKMASTPKKATTASAKKTKPAATKKTSAKSAAKSTKKTQTKAAKKVKKATKPKTLKAKKAK